MKGRDGTVFFMYINLKRTLIRELIAIFNFYAKIL